VHEQRPHIHQLNIVVRDVERSAGFYALLGLPVGSSSPPWDRHHRSFDTDANPAVDLDSATFASVWNGGWRPERTGVVINVEVASREEVDVVYLAVTRAGHHGEQEPYDAFWGARYAVVADPDGNAIGIMSPIDPTRRSRAPTP
jgi:catechol 2,3-dioxygenase-like lactoylglutathione lyase family enzyme